MAAYGIMKQIAGGKRPYRIASATNLSVPPGRHNLKLTGTTTIATIAAYPKDGRLLRISGSADGNVTFTNTDDPSTSGQMDVGGSNLTLADEDSVDLVCRTSGSLYWWERVNSTDN